MILQNVIVPGLVDDTSELYIRGNNYIIENNILRISVNGRISSNTYENILDMYMWKTYTNVKDISLNLMLSGKGKISIFKGKSSDSDIVVQKEFDTKEISLITIDMRQIKMDQIWFEIVAEGEVEIYSASYVTGELPQQEIYLTTVITTYKRKEMVERNIEQIKNSLLIKEGRLQLKVVDNGRQLRNRYGSDVRLYRNRNTGGSGGFKRGMEETVKCLNEFPTTNVILMDDDVEFSNEIFIRIFALLSFQKKEYLDEVIAGRMFREDNKSIQYTAVEKWNGGDLIHIGGNTDMRIEENLEAVNDRQNGEYSGWWLAVFPIEFIKNNKPLPFFLHCDDVEFGLRHGGNPIIINGVHVWHETYEHRQSPIVTYYDTRNSLIVNEMYESSKVIEEHRQGIIKMIIEVHNLKQWENKAALVLAVFSNKKDTKMGKIKLINCILIRYGIIFNPVISIIFRYLGRNINK